MRLVGTTVKSSLYVGGSLSFASGPEVAQSSPNAPDLGSGSPYNNVGLFAGSIDWDGSSGDLRVRNGMDAVVQDGNYVAASGDLTKPPGGSGPKVRLSPGGTVIAPAGPQLPIEPSAAFFELRACADRLAELPDSCNNGACASYAGLPTPYLGTAVEPGPQLDLDLDANKTNVLNLEEHNLQELSSGGIQINTTGAAIDATTPLVINVATAIGGTVNFVPPAIAAAGTAPIYIIWNFPNAAVINVMGSPPTQLRGTLMAPYAHVTSTISIEGGVIAHSFTMSGPALNDVRSFDGTIGWT